MTAVSLCVYAWLLMHLVSGCFGIVVNAMSFIFTTIPYVLFTVSFVHTLISLLFCIGYFVVHSF